MSERIYFKHKETKKPKQKKEKNELIEVKEKKVDNQNNNTTVSKTETKTTKVTTTTKSTWKRTIPFMPTNWEDSILYYIEQGKKNEYRDLEFEKILGMKQSTLKKYLQEKLTSFGYDYNLILNEDGFLYAQGKVPVLLVAHMDTVHSHTPFQFIYKDEYLFSPQGIGGDDRCGIWMILNIIKEINCSVLFTEDEESGCIGAHKFCSSYVAKGLQKLDKPFNYIIELDRRGKNDCVFYDCDNRDFEDFIIDASNGYFNTEWGSCSDICYIAPSLNTAAVNLSCGYYQEHCLEHYINLKEMYNNIMKVKEILNYSEQKYFEYVSSYRSYGNYYDRGGRLVDFYYDRKYKDYSSYGDDYYYEDYYGKRYYDDDYYNYDVNSYNYDKYGYTETKKETKQYYHIQFKDKDNIVRTAEIKAKTEDEAIGIFVKAYSTVCYDDVILVMHE